MAEMFDIPKEKIESNEPFPEILEQFMKNNPGMNQESLYLCESVDMDGNVIDTKIGVNLLTNYGLSDHFVNGNIRQDAMKIWLGSGQSAPDPTASTLQTYISNLENIKKDFNDNMNLSDIINICGIAKIEAADLAPYCLCRSSWFAP